MKNIEVVAGIIVQDSMPKTVGEESAKVSGLYFATARGYGDYKGFWEFPGGKMEPGETREQALVRELREELSVDVCVGDFLCTVEHDYPNFHITMHCFFCTVVGGELTLLEHESAQWVNLENLGKLQWCPADVQVVETLRKWALR